jgi:Helix-turn-helix domain
MSYRHVNYVRDNSKTKGTARLLLLTIATRTDDDGYAYPGYPRLAKDTGMTVRSIRRLIEKEIPMDEMEIIQGGSRKGQKRFATVYRVIIKGDDPAPDAQGKSHDPARDAQGNGDHDPAHPGRDPAHPRQRPCASTTLDPAHDAHPILRESEEKSKETTTTRAREPSTPNGSSASPDVVVVPSVFYNEEGTEKESLLSALAKYHVTGADAEEFASACPERIPFQIEHMLFLGDKVKNRPAWLVTAIREDWAPPEGFVSSAQRAAEQERMYVRWAEQEAEREREKARWAEQEENMRRAEAWRAEQTPERLAEIDQELGITDATGGFEAKTLRRHHAMKQLGILIEEGPEPTLFTQTRDMLAEGASPDEISDMRANWEKVRARLAEDMTMSRVGNR